MEENETKLPAEDLDTTEKQSQRRNWVTDLYDRANLSVKQLDMILIALLVLIVALFVIFGK